MTFGCALAILFDENSQNWQYFVFLLPANFGQGLTFPSSLFTMIAAFDQKGSQPLITVGHFEQLLTPRNARPSHRDKHCLSLSCHWLSMGHCHH